ncbi:PREDICTED: uncharacterized protein LOC104817065 [Tarenaya hassleriana]|uniref:uncharacterized protein LOC104817065 n=1 Tax=Tarenaya hassleriana TaxID=28532 RepID=UPI00053C6DB1|nr:PREDICTED: uncharacterized protein LOC104817065 [Tarenaya hassleriana]
MASLLNIPSQEIIKETLLAMPNNKAPGPDGYTKEFFVSSWEIVGADLVAAVQKFFRSRQLLGQINATTIALIPKRPGAVSLTEFRPISCCNLVYKLISSILAKRILEALGIPLAFISLIKACITTPRFSVSINGELAGFFESQRGLRQGDPLSPYLFILAIEVLSKLLDRASSEGTLKSHSKCGRPRVTHLAFADDVIIFSKADTGSLAEIKQILNEFGHISGLDVNEAKSEVFFSGLTEAEVSPLLPILGYRHGTFPIRYLRVANWSATFLLPKSVLTTIKSLCATFLWAGSSHSARRSPSRVAWETICRPKKGGLGIRTLKDLNMVHRLKLVWRTLSDRGSLWARWLKQNVWKKKSYWTTTVSNRLSWNLRKLLSIRQEVKSFLRMELGDGTNTMFWHDTWLVERPLLDVTGNAGPRLMRIGLDATVAEACRSGHWSVPGARSDALESILIRLTTVQAPTADRGPDIATWKHKPGEFKREFSTANTWELIREHSIEVDWYQTTWFKHAFAGLESNGKLMPTLATINCSPSSYMVEQYNQLHGESQSILGKTDCASIRLLLVEGAKPKDIHRRTQIGSPHPPRSRPKH